MRLTWLATPLLALGAAAAADEPPSPQAPAVSAVLNCRAEADPAARLACFDRTVGAFDQAVRQADVTVVDRSTIREARRGLFGFSLKDIKLFKDSPERETPVEAIDAAISSVGTGSSGGLLLTLDSGARWQQIDQDYVNRPQAGAKVTIRRATMGGYMAKIGNGRAFRVRRLAD